MIKAFILLIISTLIISCHSQPRQVSKKDNNASQDYCYLKVFNNEYKDSMQLSLHLNKDSVDGNYIWVLPGKDGKSGTITGTLAGDTINGNFQYMQEGGNYTDAVKITFTPTQAIVIQNPDSQYPLVDTLSAENCKVF